MREDIAHSRWRVKLMAPSADGVAHRYLFALDTLVPAEYILESLFSTDCSCKQYVYRERMLLRLWRGRTICFSLKTLPFASLKPSPKDKELRLRVQKIIRTNWYRQFGIAFFVAEKGKRNPILNQNYKDRVSNTAFVLRITHWVVDFNSEI